MSKPARSKPVPDSILLANVPPTLQRAESLHPGASTIERAASNDPLARAIMAAWRPSLPVIEVR